MHYYQKNIGDYSKKTGHLTALEHGVYNLIIDGYYDREQGPTLVEATRWARARSEEEKAAVIAVLDEFFILGEDGRHTQSRVQEELNKYHARAETNRVIAFARESKKRERSSNDSSTIRAQVVHLEDQNREPNHKPITNNHKPIESSTPIPPSGGLPAKKDSAIALKTYLENCKVSGVKSIPEDDPVFDYAQKIGLPDDFLRLQFLEFRDRYTMPGAKKYKAWKTVFRKSVQGNWFKLWYCDASGQYLLTTVGQQADRSHKDAA